MGRITASPENLYLGILQSEDIVDQPGGLFSMIVAINIYTMASKWSIYISFEESKALTRLRRNTG